MTTEANKVITVGTAIKCLSIYHPRVEVVALMPNGDRLVARALRAEADGVFEQSSMQEHDVESARAHLALLPSEHQVSAIDSSGVRYAVQGIILQRVRGQDLLSATFLTAHNMAGVKVDPILCVQ
jgi:hypothetical protein